MRSSLRIFAVALLCTVLSLAANAASGPFYTVIFGFTIDASGKLIGFHAVDVYDPQSDMKTPVKVALPTQYLDAVRTLVVAKHYPPSLENGKPKEAYTWFFYVPSQPTRADLDPTKQN